MTPRRPAQVMRAGAYLLTCACLLAGCGEAAPADRTPQATAACDAVEFPTVQFGNHLIGDAEPPVDYSSTPPTSGWHASGEPPVGVFDDPIGEPRQVSALEVGGVVVTHDGLAAEDLAALTAVVQDRFPDRVVVTPYPPLEDGTTTLASWGVLQRCEGLDLDALAAFVEVYAEPILPEDA